MTSKKVFAKDEAAEMAGGSMQAAGSSTGSLSSALCDCLAGCVSVCVSECSTSLTVCVWCPHHRLVDLRHTLL
eukprot:scaffold4610_cov180-Ochromonas_danica.AAC.4